MPATRKPYHHGDLRRQLIATALNIIAEHGVGHVTMREISRIIGVSRMAAYRHFKNKHELLCAVAEHGFLAMAQGYEEIFARTGPNAMDTLVALGRFYVTFALENPSLYRLMFGSALTREERPASMREAADKAFGNLPATVARCQEQGTVRQGSSLALASILWSAMHGLSSLLIDGQLQTEGYEDGFPIFLTNNMGKQQSDAGKLLDLVVVVLLQGLASEPGGPAR